MNPFVVEAKRILGPALAEATKSMMQTPSARTSFTRAPSPSGPAVLAAFLGGAALMVLLAPEGRARVSEAFRRVVGRAPKTPQGNLVPVDLTDEEPSGAME